MFSLEKVVYNLFFARCLNGYFQLLLLFVNGFDGIGNHPDDFFIRFCLQEIINLLMPVGVVYVVKMIITC